MEQKLLKIFWSFSKHPDYWFKQNYIFFMKYNTHNFKEETSLQSIDMLVEMLGDQTKNVRILTEETLEEIKKKTTNKDIKCKIEKTQEGLTK